MKRFNFFKYTTLGNKVDTTYFDYWFFKKLVATGGQPTPPIEGEGTDFELETTTRKKFDVIELKGDTSQTTYSGANLLNEFDTAGQTQSTAFSVDSDGWVTFNYVYGTTPSGFHNYYTNFPNLSTDTNYAVVAEIKELEVTGTGNFTLCIAATGTNANAFTSETRLYYQEGGDLTLGTHVITKKTKADFTGLTRNNAFFVSVGAAQQINIKMVFRLSYLADTSVTPSTFVYQPYVGGTASPNPDYPQDVNVVTGTQTLTITNGTDVQTYPITLGTIELAKIGTYQDYIYKSGDDWYVHKNIGKIVLDGSEGYWSQTGNLNVFYRNYSEMATPASGDTMPAVISNYYTAETYNSLYNAVYDYGISLRHQAGGLAIRNKDCANYTALNTWLSNHNTTIYYALATPTDTQITDATLISNLETILADGHLKKGTNAIKTTATSTNLPTIIYIKTN